MNAIVIEHVPVSELPAAWRNKLGESTHASVTVRIEAEAANTDSGQDLLFGLWRNHADIAATAIEHGMVLLTANAKHYRAVEGLRLEAFDP